MLKDLEAALKKEPAFGQDPVNVIWRAFEQTQAVVTENTEQSPASVPSVSGSSVSSVSKRSSVHRFADLVSLVRFALEQQPVLEPFSDSVNSRFESWLKQKDEQALAKLTSKSDRAEALAKAGPPGALAFTSDQLSWLHPIRDHIATSLSIEQDDLELSPFNQRGGLGRAHQLFGAQLPQLLEELNTTLAA